MRIVFSPEAAADLEAIGDFIHQDSPSAAIRFIGDIRQRCQAILAAPHGGTPRPELGPNLRSIPYGRYIVFYKVEADQVSVVRVLHSSRDINSLFLDA